MKIAVIRNAGTAVASRVLNGVYGILQRETPESPIGTFVFAPEFNRVSHLFSMIESGSAPIEVSGVIEYDVPDSLADDFRHQLMHDLGQRWESMYKSIMPSEGVSITTTLVQAEANRVKEGVTSHLRAMGVRLYKIEGQVEAQSSANSLIYDDMAVLTSEMKPVWGAPFEVLEVEEVETAPGTTPPIPEIVVPEGLAGQVHVFENCYAAGTLTAAAHVASTTREGAAALAQFILNGNSLRETYVSQTLTLCPVKVENIRQGEAVIDDDVTEDEEWGGNQERGDTPGY